MTIQTISTKQLRQDFNKVKQAMDNNQTLLLLYRSKPLAQIKPLPKTQPTLRTFTKKQLTQWEKDDQLTSQQQTQINEIIKNLP